MEIIVRDGFLVGSCDICFALQKMTPKWSDRHRSFILATLGLHTVRQRKRDWFWNAKTFAPGLCLGRNDVASNDLNESATVPFAVVFHRFLFLRWTNITNSITITYKRTGWQRFPELMEFPLTQGDCNYRNLWETALPICITPIVPQGDTDPLTVFATYSERDLGRRTWRGQREQWKEAFEV